MENLHNLILLDLRHNNIVLDGDDMATMGRTELRQRFGDRVVLDDDTTEFEQVEISKNDVYRDLMGGAIHWSFDELKKLRPSSIPPSGHTEASLMEVWNGGVYMRKWRESNPEGVAEMIYGNEGIIRQVYGSSVDGLLEQNVREEDRNRNIARILALLVKNIDKDTMEWNIAKLAGEDKEAFKKMWDDNKARLIVNNNKWTIEDFIHHIYNPSEEYRRWRIARGEEHDDPDTHPSIVLAKNLIGNILDMMSGASDEDVVVSNINGICEGLEHCPDRQIAEMRLAYQVLTGETRSDDLKGFVREVVGAEKERVFGHVVTPGTGQNVHVLNVLTNKMADEIGLNRTVETGLGTMGQDRFRGWPGNILRAFYATFTPEHMFRVLSEHVNGSGKMTSSASMLIRDMIRDRVLSKEDVKRMCKYREEDVVDIDDLADEEQAKYIAGESCGITEEFAKWYLAEMGLVVVKAPASGTGGGYARRAANWARQVLSWARRAFGHEE